MLLEEGARGGINRGRVAPVFLVQFGGVSGVESSKFVPDVHNRVASGWWLVVSKA